MMNRGLYSTALVVMMLLITTTLCYSYTLDTKGEFSASCPKEKGYMETYNIASDGTITFKFRGECQYSAGDTAYNRHWFVTATWKGSTAYEDIKIDNKTGYTISQCNLNPWLSDTFSCTLTNSGGEALKDAGLSADNKFPLTWPVLTAEQKKQIGIAYEAAATKNAQTKTPPKQPIGIISPLMNQVLIGPPAKLHFSITHDANWPVNIKFSVYGMVGKYPVWLSPKLNIQNQKTVYKTGPDTVTPIGVTSGDVTLDLAGKWQLQAWYDNPGTSMSKQVPFTVQSLNPLPAVQKTIPPGGIKLK